MYQIDLKLAHHYDTVNENRRFALKATTSFIYPFPCCWFYSFTLFSVSDSGRILCSPR